MVDREILNYYKRNYASEVIESRPETIRRKFVLFRPLPLIHEVTYYVYVLGGKGGKKSLKNS